MVAYRALTDSTSHNTDQRVLGPELLTYDDDVRILSDIIDLTLTLRHL